MVRDWLGHSGIGMPDLRHLTGYTEERVGLLEAITPIRDEIDFAGVEVSMYERYFAIRLILRVAEVGSNTEPGQRTLDVPARDDLPSANLCYLGAAPQAVHQLYKVIAVVL